MEKITYGIYAMKQVLIAVGGGGKNYRHIKSYTTVKIAIEKMGKLPLPTTKRFCTPSGCSIPIADAPINGYVIMVEVDGTAHFSM